jgi:transposase
VLCSNKARTEVWDRTLRPRQWWHCSPGLAAWRANDPVLGECQLFLRRSGQNPHRWATKRMKSKKELLANKKHIKRKSAKAKHNCVLGIHNPNAAGVDIGATEMHVAVPPDRLEMNVRCFGTFTQDLLAIVQWFRECEVTSVAMESTGVYWIPLYELLEQEGFEVYLVNARHVKNVPGRKSDVQDCQWLQYLHSVGLLRASYRPAQDICALRSISRYRDNLLRSAVQHLQHMQGALDQMNVRLHHVIADLSGTTGMAIVEAILAGQRDPQELAKLRDPRIQATPETIAKALEGNWRVEHLFVLGQALQSWKQVQQQLGQCDQKLEELSRQLEGKIDLATNPLAPSAKYAGKLPKTKNQPQGAWREELYRQFGVDLTEVPGLSLGVVQTLFVELGPDLSDFPTPPHFAAWLGLCPDNAITGGKVIRRATRPNRQRIRVALRMAATSLYRSKTHLGETFRRLRARLGAPKAITAMAHKLARIIWHLITKRVSYDESIFALREEELLRRKQRQLRNLAHSLGFSLVPNPLAAATSSAEVS